MRRVQRGAALFFADTPARSLYVVRLGCFKSQMTSRGGYEQITKFSMQGDVLGLDGVGMERHALDAVAVEDSQVWIVNMDENDRHLAVHIQSLMGRQLRDHLACLEMLGTMSAEQRVGSFLLDLSARFADRRLSATRFSLQMPRADIASYLGVSAETVSRVLGRFQRANLLAIERQRHLTLRDVGELSRLSSGANQSIGPVGGRPIEGKTGTRVRSEMKQEGA